MTGSAVVDRKTGQFRFIAQPYLRITNVSHVPKYDKEVINLTFADLMTLESRKRSHIKSR